MRIYELILVLKTALSDAQKKKAIDAVKNLSKDLKITKEDHIGIKPLSYKIKKELSGYFVHLIMEVKEVIPQDLEKKILTNEDILRHLLLRTK
jgi:small subunit ribosomal protein S6